MVYDYEDEFVINSIDPLVLSQGETDSITEVELIGTFDEPHKGNLVKALVYMKMAILQLEAEGMQEKYDAYSNEFKRVLNVAKTTSPATVSNIPIGRG